MSTESSPTERATRACRLCRSRKKACDKQLPQCGYCAQHQAICEYDFEVVAEDQSRRDGLAAASVLALRSIIPSQLNFREQGLPTNSTNLYRVEVERIIQSMGWTTQNICQRFIEEFDGCFSIVAPKTIQDILELPDMQPPDTWVMILTMLNMVLNPVSDTLYMASKTLFTTLHATHPVSAAQLQAAVLLCAYEYSCGSFGKASISIAMCDRMASVLGISRWLFPSNREHLDRIDTTPEQWNIRWAIETLDRLLYSTMEFGDKIQWEIAAESLAYLPLDLNGLDPNRSDLNDALDILQREFHRNVPTSTLKESSEFILQAQAVFKLGMIQRAINAQDDLTRPEQLDDEIQTFLVQLTAADMGPRILSPGGVTIAILVRSLFVLHKWILSSIPYYRVKEEELNLIIQRSKAALQTAAKLVVDAGMDHVHHDGTLSMHSLPLCCRENVRDAKKVYTEILHPGDHRAELQQLELIQAGLNKRWPKDMTA